MSEVNETELVLAPQEVKDVKDKIPTDCLRFLEIDDEVDNLAQTYINEKALGKLSENDAYHTALASASVSRLDCLISWNFKHIVNFDKIKMFHSINIRYPIIDIRSPLEFLSDDNNN